MNAPEAAIVVEGLTKVFSSGGETVTVLKIERFHVAAGSITALVGPSGSGKTTLLHLIAGILSPTHGRVVVEGVNIPDLPGAERDRFRADHLGYIFQTFNLLPALTALENVMVPMMFSSLIPKPKQRARAKELLERMGLGHRLHHRPFQLSHGEQQRVAIARALANRPRIVLADEPSASLDPKTARTVMDLLLNTCRELETTLFVVTHDRGLLLRRSGEPVRALNAHREGSINVRDRPRSGGSEKEGDLTKEGAGVAFQQPAVQPPRPPRPGS